METFSSIKRKLLEAFHQYGIDRQEARREIDLIVEFATGCSLAQQLRQPEEALDRQALAVIEDIAGKRAQRLPLQYCLGETWFMGLRFAVEPGVLIPRPDTETLVEAVLALLKHKPAPTIVDIGTGSGAIAVSFLHYRTDARAVAIDISPTAIAICARNAQLNGVADRLTSIICDWSQYEPDICFDAVISNPPYVPVGLAAELQPEVAVFEPREAVFGCDEDGLGFYRGLSSKAGRYLRDGGFIAVEVGQGQAEAVAAIFAAEKWHGLMVRSDLNSIPRVVAAFHSKIYIEN